MKVVDLLRTTIWPQYSTLSTIVWQSFGVHPTTYYFWMSPIIIVIISSQLIALYAFLSQIWEQRSMERLAALLRHLWGLPPAPSLPSSSCPSSPPMRREHHHATDIPPVKLQGGGTWGWHGSTSLTRGGGVRARPTVWDPRQQSAPPCCSYDFGVLQYLCFDDSRIWMDVA